MKGHFKVVGGNVSATHVTIIPPSVYMAGESLTFDDIEATYMVNKEIKQKPSWQNGILGGMLFGLGGALVGQAIGGKLETRYVFAVHFKDGRYVLLECID